MVLAEPEEDNLNLQTCKLSYMNNTINDFELPETLNEFRKKVKSLFLLESKNNEDIVIMYIYHTDNDDDKDNDNLLEVKTDENYNLMLTRLKNNNIKDSKISIETDKLPSIISRTNPNTFDKEIQSVILCELKAAGDRIKKYLSGNKKCYPLTKKEKEEDFKICCKCEKCIIGNSYRSVTDIEEKIYCEKCSYLQKDPIFIIK